jgi:CRISPR-associated protein Cas5a/b/c
MIGIRFDLEFVWGFQCKVVGLSKSSPSFYYPPPTTILGAIAEQIAKEYKIGEKRGKEIIPLLSANLLALGIKPLNCTPVKFSDINRLITLKVTGRKVTGRGPYPRPDVTLKVTRRSLYPRPDDIAGSFDAPAVGKTMLSPLEGEPPRLRAIVIFKDKTISLQSERIEIASDIIWRIHRIGSKESLVSVIDVRDFHPNKIEGDVDTEYSFPLLEGVTLLREDSPSWVRETVVNPFTIKSYDEKQNPVIDYLQGINILQYMQPIKLAVQPRYRVKLSPNSCGYKVNNEQVIGRCQQQ